MRKPWRQGRSRRANPRTNPTVTVTPVSLTRTESPGGSAHWYGRRRAVAFLRRWCRAPSSNLRLSDDAHIGHLDREAGACACVIIEIEEPDMPAADRGDEYLRFGSFELDIRSRELRRGATTVARL